MKKVNMNTIVESLAETIRDLDGTVKHTEKMRKTNYDKYLLSEKKVLKLNKEISQYKETISKYDIAEKINTKTLANMKDLIQLQQARIETLEGFLKQAEKAAVPSTELEDGLYAIPFDGTED